MDDWWKPKPPMSPEMERLLRQRLEDFARRFGEAMREAEEEACYRSNSGGILGMLEPE